MKRIRLFRILALLMTIHFCGVAVCSYEKDTIVMESESDADSEAEDNKKENKIISNSINFPDVLKTHFRLNRIDSRADWTVPHLEISNPPPELI